MQDEGGRRRLRLDGRWTVAEAVALEPRLREAARSGRGAVIVDAAGIEALDLTGAWFLHSLERQLGATGGAVEWAGERPAQLEFIDRLEAQREKAAPAEPETPSGLQGIVGRLGHSVVHTKEGALDLLGFVGAVTAGYGRTFGSLRRRSFIYCLI
jgi:hypothetical protein